MRIKQVAGILALGVGIYLIVHGVNATRDFAHTKGLIEDLKNFFTHNPLWNPIIKLFKGTPQEKVADYDVQTLLSIIGGIVLTIVGAVTLIVHRKR